MNSIPALLLLAALAPSPAIAAEDPVAVRDLPAPVQQTLRRSGGEGAVKEVTQQTVDGRRVYVVEFERNLAPNPRLRIAEDGSVLRDPVPVLMPPGSGAPLAVSPDGLAAPVSSPVDLEKLPAAVRRTARREAAGRDIVDVDSETWNGRHVYEVEFRERGLNSRVYVGDDGEVVRDEHRPGDAFWKYLVQTQLEQSPQAVQEAVRRAARGREVLDIDLEAGGGNPVYRVVVDRDGHAQEIRVAQDGRILAERP